MKKKRDSKISKLNNNKIQFIGLGVILGGLLLISIVIFADTNPLGKHSSEQVFIDIQGNTMTLETAIKKGYYDISRIPTNDPDVYKIPRGGHDASQIFVSVNGNESSLLEAINYVHVEDGCLAAGGTHVGSECRFERSSCPEGWHFTGWTQTTANTCSNLDANESSERINWNIIRDCGINDTINNQTQCSTSSSSWSSSQVPNCTASYEFNSSDKCLVGICKSKITALSCAKDSGSTVTRGLCGSPGHSYSKEIFVGHSADEIWLQGYQKTLQQAINDGDFCYTYGWNIVNIGGCQGSCHPGTQLRNITCRNDGTNAIVPEGYCDESSKPAASVSCTITSCGDGSCNCGETCSTCPADCGACSTPSCERVNKVCLDYPYPQGYSMFDCKTSSGTICGCGQCGGFPTDGALTRDCYITNDPDCVTACKTEGQGCTKEFAHEGSIHDCCDGLDCSYGTCVYHDEITCLVAGTKVLMADGSEKNIENIRVGDLLDGGEKIINKVLATEQVRIGNRGTYIINDGELELTGDHPILTTHGWKVANLEQYEKVFSMTPEYIESLITDILPGLDINDVIQAMKDGNLNEMPGILEVGDKILTVQGTQEVKSIVHSFERPKEEIVYDIVLDNNNKFFANDFVVHNKFYG